LYYYLFIYLFIYLHDIVGRRRYGFKQVTLLIAKTVLLGGTTVIYRLFVARGIHVVAGLAFSEIGGVF
jgi:hypothetical protein